MVGKVEQQVIPSVAENQAAPTGTLTTGDKIVPVKVVSGANEQILRVMIVPPPTKPEGWTWGQIAKYSAYAAGAGVVVYYGYTQLWDLVKDTFSVLKTARTVVKDGIPVVGGAIRTGVDASEKLYHGLGQGVAATRGILNRAGVQTPPIPTDRAGMVALGTNVANIGLVGAATAAANAAYLAPVAAASVLAFGKPGKLTGIGALGAILGEAARPGTVKEVGDKAEVVLKGAQEACAEWPEGCNAAINTAGALSAGALSLKLASTLGGPGLALAGTAAAVVAKEIVDPGTLKEAAKAGKAFVAEATPHVENAVQKGKNVTQGVLDAYRTWPLAFQLSGGALALYKIVPAAVSMLASVGNAIKANKINTAVGLTAITGFAVEFFAPGALKAGAEMGKSVQDVVKSHWNNVARHCWTFLFSSADTSPKGISSY